MTITPTKGGERSNMKSFLYFILFLIIAALVIVLGIILGNLGGWYLAWLFGTVVVVLVSAAGGALMDTQDADQQGGPGS